MIDRVIFDADGTLLDSMPVWMTAGIRYLKTLGLIPEPDLPQKLLPLTMFETASYLKNTYHLLYCEDMIVRQINELIMDSYENTVPLKDGVLDLLEGLTQLSIPLTVATATDRPAIEAAILSVRGTINVQFSLVISLYTESPSSIWPPVIRFSF